MRKLLFTIAGLLFSAVACASSIEKMEAVVVKAPDIRTFLADPALVEEYYAEASAYYGKEKFPRAAYDAILEQLGELDRKSPTIGARLWEGSGLGADFKLQLDLPRSGLELRDTNWIIYLNKKIRELEKSAEPLKSMRSQARTAHVNEIFARKLAEIEKFETEVLPQTPKAERGRLTQEFYRVNFREDKDLQTIGAYLAHRKLSRSGPLSGFLRSGSADGVLHAWGELRKAGGLNSNQIIVPDRLQRFLAESALPDLPKPEKLEIKGRKAPSTELFKVATQTSRDGKKIPAGAGPAGALDFRALPRRFHGIFKGVRLGECVGGSCNTLRALTPERWATIALADSRLYQVERNGAYQGFVQVVPVGLREKTYGALEFGSPLLNQKSFVLNPKTGKVEFVQLATALSKRLQAELPAGWDGLVVSAGSEINNAGVLGDFRKTPVYSSGKIVGNRSEVKHLDPLAETIVKSSPTKGVFISNYGGNMITDATAKSASPLTELNLEARAGQRTFPAATVIENPKKLFALLKNGKPEMLQAFWVDVSGRKIDPAVVKSVLEMAAAERFDIDPVLYQNEIRQNSRIKKDVGKYLFAMRDQPRAGEILQWERSHNQEYDLTLGFDRQQIATLNREGREKFLRGCQKGFASLFADPTKRGVTAAMAATTAGIGAAYYATRPGPAEKQEFGCRRPNDAHLALRKGRWGCDEAEGGRRYEGCQSTETFERVAWHGITAMGVKGNTIVPLLSLVDTSWKGVDGNSYGSCEFARDKVVCLSCEGSTPVTPVWKKVRIEDQLAFEQDADGNFVFLGLADHERNGFKVQRQADGQLYLLEWKYGTELTLKRLVDVYPQWKDEIRRAEERH